MAEGEDRWVLFIDESGDFSNDGQRVFVVGVLAHFNNEPSFQENARRALQRAAPLSPWPLHSRYVNQPVMHPLWMKKYPDRIEDRRLERELRRGYEALEGVADEALERAREQLSQGREPRYEDMDELSRALRASRSAWPAVRGYCQKVIGPAIFEAIRDIIEDESVGEMMGFVASEDQLGQASQRKEQGSSSLLGQDRYLQVLVALLERVHDVLARRGGAHVVDLELANRHVWHPLLDSDVHLSRDLVQSAFEFLDPLLSEAEVRWSVRGLRAFDEDASPGLVLADFLANHAWRSLERSTTLEALRHKIGLKLPLNLGRGVAPHPVSLHDARSFLLEHRQEQEPSPAHLGASMAWAREQALVWQELL